ncbi:hypothetical protein DO97_15135 [Neosynechococcus sphagnicola sy1]|uniref:Chlororespiratory reduction protein 7 n=1 Tax=Neosynechococcus sphagnicola sy1 TaxID=1497020 RepID=A0A098TMT9_9CYAN|nr:chlororespiratory reduction protein 7 [Neosynechococcus sphagnicola]KGF73645.1 hypothetical protein DO97_15135 [Neosynechococcus sphagnicola sy1]
MSNPHLYDLENFVVLEANQPEQFLTAAELLDKLKVVLSHRQQDLPQDLHRFPTIEAQAQYLLETSCDLEMEPGNFFQWYAVRLQK